MSIHIDLSPEAQTRLQVQKRNSTISAVIVSILAVVLVGLVLGLINLVLTEETQKKVVTYLPGIEEADPPKKPKLKPSIERNPSTPSFSSAPNIAAEAISPVEIALPDVEVLDPAENFGLNDDFGQALGSGNGDGLGANSRFSGISADMSKRCNPAERMARLLETGGTEECEQAVVNGLRWMKDRQHADGSWKDGGKAVGMTALSLLAYLGHCETPYSEEFGDSCLRAILYLINSGEKNGGAMATSLADKHWPYEHAIATYALAEAYAFSSEMGSAALPGLSETVQKAGQLVIDKQHSTSGGWDYYYDQSGARGGDLSVTGWHIQALKACKRTGIEFSGMKRCLRQAEDYVRARINDEGGFGYTGQGGNHQWDYDNLSGVGVLSLQILGAKSSRETRRGLRYIVENSRFEYVGEACDLYAHYYEGQACMNRGGSAWEHYNELFRDQILKNQAEDGSWKRPGANADGIHAVGAEFVGNVHYRTCLATLMLEVYYRFLPSGS